MTKPNSKLIDTPMSELVGNPSNRKGSDSAVYNGEPGLPGRSTGGAGVPEVTYDKMGGYNPQKPGNVATEK